MKLGGNELEDLMIKLLCPVSVTVQETGSEDRGKTLNSLYTSPSKKDKARKFCLRASKEKVSDEVFTF